MVLDQIRESIKDFIKERGIRESEIAKSTGVDARTVRNFLEKGGGNLRTVEKILRYLSRFGWDYDMAFPVPVYEEVAAGNGREVYGEIAGTVFIPREFYRKGTIAIRVRGNSMEPSLVDGSIIGVNTNEKELRHGKIYVLYFPWKGTVVKRIYFSEDGKIMAKSDNMEYPDIVVDRESSMHVIGRVVWSFQRYY